MQCEREFIGEAGDEKRCERPAVWHVEVNVEPIVEDGEWFSWHLCEPCMKNFESTTEHGMTFRNRTMI